jgi:GH25 family lysozyme M1 (1,4-beta-N-acetylmuramidase)
MTIFGPDVSSFQRGLVLSRLASAAFVIAKATEGTYYTDAEYQGWRQQCAGLGRPFIWYHFLSGQTAAAQVAHTLANVDTRLPGMLDAEPRSRPGSSRPGLRSWPTSTPRTPGA